MKYIVEYLDENEARRTKEVEITDDSALSYEDLWNRIAKKLHPKALKVKSIKVVQPTRA